MKEPWRTRVAWALTIPLAALMLLAGIFKFVDPAGTRMAVAQFGYPAMLHWVVAVLETAGGALLLAPRLSAYGAILSATAMGGAFASHVVTGIGRPWVPGIFALIAVAVIRLRWADRARV